MKTLRDRGAALAIGIGATAVHDLTMTMTEDSGPALRIFAFSEAADVSRVVAAVRDGADDYLVGPIGGDALAAPLYRTDRPGGPVRSRISKARARIERLTPRERQVLTGMAHGLSNRQMGHKLGINPRTVEIHRANMGAKIGAQLISEAIRVVINAALLD